MKHSKHTLSDQWSSKWAFILAATGAAVGLGNIWRFPYLLGTHGGSAFLVLYLFFLVLLGLPALIAEILIGRQARTNPVDAMRLLARQHGHSTVWQGVGILGAFALIFILSFYSVVSGWSIAYLWHTLSSGFSGQSANTVQAAWQRLLSHPEQMLLWHTVFITLTIGVIILGVEKGLERATKWMMPALYLILIMLVIIAASFGQFQRAWHYLFSFNWHAITTKVLISALGQAFFTLALGAGAMLTYGAYAPKQASLLITVSVIALLDVVVALLAGLAIFPLVFAFHLNAQAGPGLMFITLPIAFAQISGGNFIAALFFILLLFAAWTSSINLAEPLVITLMHKSRLNRTQAALCIGLCAWLLGIGSVLSFNVWQHLNIAGYTFFSLTTDLSTNVILPLGGLGYSIFAGWILPKNITEEELNSNAYPIWLFLIRYIVPLCVIVILIFTWI